MMCIPWQKEGVRIGGHLGELWYSLTDHRLPDVL